MKITMISIESFLGISNFKTTEMGKLNRVTGRNGSGKSSIVKAVLEAFKSSGVNPKLIKVGEDGSKILIGLDDGSIIDRQLTPAANRVKVVTGGQPLPAPQKFLNDLVGQFIIFNPIAFFLAKPKERRQMLLSSIPISLDQAMLFDMLGGDSSIPVGLEQYDYSGHGLTVLERIQEDVYERRHEQGLEVTRLKKSLEQDKLDIPDTFDGERYKGFDVQEKIGELTAAKAAISQHEQDVTHLERLRTRSVQIKTEIARLRDEIARLQDERAEAQNEGEKLAQKVETFVIPDTQTPEADIAGYKDNQKLMLKLEEIDRKQGEIEESAETHSALDEFYKALTTQVPRKLLSNVKLPVDNLEIKGDDILVNRVAIETLATSKQWDFCISVAESVAGNLKVICCDGLEALDKQNYEAFEARVAKGDCQYIITMVTEGDLKMESVNGDMATQPAIKPAKKRAGKQVDAGF